MKYPFVSLIVLVLMLLVTSCKIQVVTTKSTAGVLESKYQQIRKTEIRHGYYRLYHENGRIAIEMFYKNGKLQGDEKSYHPNGQLHYISTSEIGSYEGPFKYWYATGVLHQEGNCVNNNIEGELKTYYPNGVLKEIVSFSKSVENGAYIMYHQNGKIKEEGHFLNGPVPVGTIKHYNDEAVFIRKQFCEKGTCETVWELNPLENKTD